MQEISTVSRGEFHGWSSATDIKMELFQGKAAGIINESGPKALFSLSISELAQQVFETLYLANRGTGKTDWIPYALAFILRRTCIARAFLRCKQAVWQSGPFSVMLVDRGTKGRRQLPVGRMVTLL